MLRRFVMAMACVPVLVACGGEEPTCDECLASGSSALLEDGCWPYCEGEPDMDADGIPDTEDACPDTPETENGYQDTDGCPDTAPTIPATLAGTWAGQTVVSVNGGQPFASDQVLAISVSADLRAGVITGFCPDGSGMVPLEPLESDPGARWAGIYACPPGPWGQCVSVGMPITANFLLFGVSVMPSPTGVTVQAYGTALLTDGRDDVPSNCDTSGEFISAMAGRP